MIKRAATGKRCSLGLDIVLHYSTFATQLLKRVCATFNALIPLGTLQSYPFCKHEGSCDLMRMTRPIRRARFGHDELLQPRADFLGRVVKFLLVGPTHDELRRRRIPYRQVLPVLAEPGRVLF